MPDLQKDTLQPLFSLLSLVIREEVQLHIACLQIACDDAEPADKQAGIDFPVKGIQQRRPDILGAGCVRSHPDCSHHMARVQPPIVVQGHGTIIGWEFLQRNGVKRYPERQLFRTGFPFDQIHHQLINHL